MRNIKFTLLLVLSALLLVTVSVSCQAEGNYQLYESELTRLQQITERLDKLNSQLSNELATSKTNLTQLQNELESCKADLTQLQNQLQASQAELTQAKNYLMTAENSLRKAEESFKQYEKEAEARIKRLVIQRNVVGVIAVILGVIAI